MTDVEWKEPPTVRRGKPPITITDRQQRALKANPGEWARILRDLHKTTATAVVRRVTDLGFEVTTRVASVDGKSRKRYDIYARWPGDG